MPGVFAVWRVPAFARSEDMLDRTIDVTRDADSAERDNLDIRRRRLAYRANHRGTKEMDWLVGRYADAYLETLNDPALSEFERFLELPEPQLQKWLLEPESVTAVEFVGEFAELIARIRAFHGLTTPAKSG